MHDPETAAAARAPAGDSGPAGDSDADTSTHQKHLMDCLDLLRGPSDERRFVGLMLVTRLLPAGDLDTIRQVHSAVGASFVSRLLAPLHSGAALQQSSNTEEALHKMAATCALGLAVLSSFVQVPELAAGQDLVDKVPLFLKVVRDGGVLPAIAHATGTTQLPGDPAADDAAVHDALECALAVAGSGEEGRQVAAESGALSAAAAALRRCTTNSLEHAATEVLAVKLAAALLLFPDRAAVIATYASEVQQLLPCLAHLLALPTALPNVTDLGHAQREQLVQLQLEALRTFLLILPLPHAAALHRTVARSAPHSSWAADVRVGLHTLLRARAAALQRHSALQLTAAVAALAGPDWLLGEVPGAAPGAFFQLLVEVTRIETSVLLHDALSPDIPVPLGTQAHAPAAGKVASGAAEGPLGAPHFQPTGPNLGGKAEGDSSGDEGVPGWDDLPPAFAPGTSVLEHLEESRREERAAAEQPQPQGRLPRPGEVVELVEGVQVPRDVGWDEGPSEEAGERAARLLPACFMLLEVEIEALAEDAQREEEAADPGRVAAAPEERGAGQPPALSDSVAARAMASLQETIETLLQFLEQMCAGGLEEGGSAPAASRQHALTVAAVRVLGRFAAEAPEAFGPRLRALLPQLLALHAPRDAAGTATGVGGGSSSASAAASTATVTIKDRATTLVTPAAAAGAAAEQLRGSVRYMSISEDLSGYVSDEEMDLEDFDLDGHEGQLFLLPLLLQVTHPAWEGQSGERQAWLAAVRQPAVLRQLMEHACCAAASRSKAVTAAWKGCMQSHLLPVCSLLLQVTQANTEEPATAEQQEWQGTTKDATEKEQTDDSAEVQASEFPNWLYSCYGDVMELIQELEVALEAMQGAKEDDVSEEQALEQTGVATCCCALLATLLAAMASAAAGSPSDEASSPSPASPPSPVLGRHPPGWLGPLNPPRLQAVSARILQGVQSAHGTLTSHCLPEQEDALGDLPEHYAALVQATGTLLQRCPQFAATCTGSPWLAALCRPGGQGDADTT